MNTISIRCLEKMSLSRAKIHIHTYIMSTILSRFLFRKRIFKYLNKLQVIYRPNKFQSPKNLTS